MIKHVFLWRVAPGVDKGSIFTVLDELPGKISEIRSWSLGPHIGEPGDSGQPWDGALVCDFDSMDDLSAYAEHPFHQDVVQRLLPLFADRAVVDFAFPAESSR